MDEEALVEAIDQDSPKEQENLELENKQVEQEEQEEVQLSALEAEAQKMGHTSKEDFIAKGGDPERWKTPHEYVSYGKLMSRLDKTNHNMDDMANKFDKRVEGLNKIHQQQMESKIKSLRNEQRSAVEASDTDRYDAAQKEIDDLSVQDTTDTTDDTSTKDPAILDWEKKNPWVKDANDPKAQMVSGLWNGYVKTNPNASISEALTYVDKQLEAMSPPQHNQRRNSANTTERGSQTQRTKGKVTSIKQLSPEFQQEYARTIDIWGDDKAGVEAFIQAAQDSEKR